MLPMIINKARLHNNTLLLIITNNSANKVSFPKDITRGTSEEISNGHNSINEIILTDKPNDIKTQRKNKLHKMCDDYTDIFSKQPIDIGKSNIVQMILIPKDNIKPLD